MDVENVMESPFRGSDAAAADPVSTDGAPLSNAGLTRFLLGPATDGGDVLEEGAMLGDVMITRFIAEGGMGRVYEGRQGMPSRTVAVKVVRPGVVSPVGIRRFQHEAHILGRLNHPGIARIYFVGVQRRAALDVPYFVMEYVEDARPITEHATQGDLSTQQRVRLFREACDAVAHGHHKGVVHRDLKPGNILVDALSRVKIIDFGVARSTDGDVALTTIHTVVGQLVGTVQYMAPEQFEGSVDDLDVRADVYALGVVLYELLAGRPPYDLAKRPVYEAARIVREVEPPSISMVNPKLRGDLATIVAKCLEKDRSRRYSSASELEADLGRHLRGEPIAAAPPRLFDALARIARRHRLAAAAAAGIIAAMVVGGVGMSIFAVQASRERAEALREKARADAEAEQSRHRLYVANLRSMQAAISARNLRLARQLYAENLGIVASPAPLEMRVVEGDLDDALVVIDRGKGPVRELGYAGDGGVLAVAALNRMDFPAEDLVWLRSVWLARANSVPPSVTERRDLACFAVGPDWRHDPIDPPEADWMRGWLSPSEAGPSLAVARHGRLEARQVAGGMVRVCDARCGDGGVVLEAHRGRVKEAVFDAAGRRIAIHAGDGSLGLWDAETGGFLGRCPVGNKRVEKFRFSPDGSRLAVLDHEAGRPSEVSIYDVSDARLLTTVASGIDLHPDHTFLAFSHDGSRIMANIHGNQLRVWDTSDGRLIGSMRGHPSTITAVEVAPDGLQIASAAANGTIRLWNAGSFELERELLGHDAPVMAMAFRPDGDTLASGAHDGSVRIWSRAMKEPLAVLPGRRRLADVRFSRDGRLLAIAPAEGGVELWNANTVERLHGLDAGGQTANEVAFSPDGSLVAAAFGRRSEEGEVRVWNAATFACLATLPGHGNGAERVVFVPDGSRLLTMSGEGTAFVWDSRTGRRIAAVAPGQPGTALYRNAVFDHDGRRFASSRRSGVIDTDTGEVVAAVPPHGRITCLAASPDGRMFASGMLMGSVHLVDFATGARFAHLVGHTDGVQSIAFDAGGQRVLTGSLDRTARLWDARSGELVRTFQGHEASVEAVLFSPDGRRIITSSLDGTIRIWDAAFGHELGSLPGQPDFPRAVAVSPDGTRLVATTADGTTRIWGLSNAAVVRARQTVTDRR